MEFLEQLESIQANESNVQQTFSNMFKNEGASMSQLRSRQKYSEALEKATELVADVVEGKKPMRKLQEAMTTDDFPYLFGDILDRMLLQNYQETPAVYRNFVRIARVSDFRDVKRFHVDGADNTLDQVDQQAEYPEEKVTEGKYSYAVKKYGRRIPFSWESMVNDDLDALQDMPRRLGRAARRTEQRFAAGLYVGNDGPLGTFFKSANNNIITGHPPLSIEGLQLAMQIIGNKTDANGEPIAIDMLHLVVPPALMVTAQNILNAIQIEATNGGGTSNQKIHAQNWMANMLRLSVDPYIPVIASNNKNSSWFLFADPADNRPALEMGFLRGHENPEIFVKAPNARRVGAGEVDPMAGDFDNDSINYKVRHVLGGTQMDPKMALASNGSGSTG